MELRLKYGEKMMQADLPDFPTKKTNGKRERRFIELHTKHIVTLQKPADILNQALDRTLGCHPFNQVFRAARNVLIVTPAPAEETGAEIYLPLLKERLNRLHVPDEEIRLLVAMRADALLAQKNSTVPLSALVGEKVRVFWHDPYDYKALEYAGLTRRGTPVFVHRLILEADCVLLCGSVTSHPFAGYGGGPRLIVPGCAGEETIHRHFSHALDPEAPHVHARCRDAVVEGNPLQEDSREAFRFITTDFLLHTILNDQRQIVGAVAGEPLQAFAAGCKAIDNMFSASIPTAAPLVIASCGGYPYDGDFRTAYTTLQRAAQIVRPDGVVIFVAECRDGFGSPALSQFLQADVRREQMTTAPFLVNHSKRLVSEQTEWPHLPFRRFYQNEIEALLALSILQKAREHRIIFVTDLPPEPIQRLGFIPTASLNEALTFADTLLSAQKNSRDIFSAILISNGTFLVPHLNGEIAATNSS